MPSVVVASQLLGGDGWMLSAAEYTVLSVAQPDPDSVSPGVYGFLVVFILAIFTWLLMRNLTGRLRRLRYREQQRFDAAHEPAANEPAERESAAREPAEHQPRSGEESADPAPS